MADQMSSITDNLPGGGVGGISGALQGGINNITNMGSSYLDKLFPPEQRERLKEKITKFATERPFLSSFLLSQIALSGGPVALFVLMTVTVFIFALLAALIVGLIGILLFILGALGVALFILLPTLFVTSFLATALWLWGTGAYFIIKWFNQKKVPGIHVPLKDGLLEQTGLQDLPLLNSNRAHKPPRSHATDSHSSSKKSNKTHEAHTSEKEKPSTDMHVKPNSFPAPRAKVDDHQTNDVSEADQKKHEHKEKTTKPKKLKESGKISADEAVQQITDPVNL